MAPLKTITNSGKNRKFPFYLKNILKTYLIPNFWCRMRLKRILATLDKRSDKEYIIDRVNYYCKLNEVRGLSAQNPIVGTFKRKGHKSVYFFDTNDIIRYFPVHYRWRYLFGDIRDLQPEPTLLKSRPLNCDNSNSVLLKMNKVRHFIFIDDRKKFSEKRDMAIFRGGVKGNKLRTLFLQKWFGSDICDAGEVGRHLSDNKEWHVKKMTLFEHLDYKFVICLEGNDVASNLKWVMSSNSLAVMPRPTCETWFMEGRLIPNVHYVEIKPDYSDLRERLQYYIEHPDEAEAIIKSANEYVAQFKDNKREKLISLLVVDKYFRMTGMKQ